MTVDALLEQHTEALSRVFGGLSCPTREHIRSLVTQLLAAGVLADPAEQAELANLREQAANAFADLTQLKGLFTRDGATEVELAPPHELVLAWVTAARDMLGDAPNYTQTPVTFPEVSMEVSAAGQGEHFVFTLQRAGKLTPHQARTRAEAELATVAEQRDELAARNKRALGWHSSRPGEPCPTCRVDGPCPTALALLDTDEPLVGSPEPAPTEPADRP